MNMEKPLPTNIHTQKELYHFLDKINYNPTFSEVIRHYLIHQKNKPATNQAIGEVIITILRERSVEITKNEIPNWIAQYQLYRFDINVQFDDSFDWAKYIDDYRKRSYPSWYVKNLEIFHQMRSGYNKENKNKQSPLLEPVPPSLLEDDIPKFVAQGSYGCVHRPSLFCEGPTHPDYKGKVSKVMTTKNMTKELKEYVLIDRADPNHNFYLGKPETCPLGNIVENKKPIKECKIGKDIVKNPSDYSLILMKDGGNNWDEFADDMNERPVNAENTIRVEQFWVEARRMLFGVKAMINHGIMHHDLKAQNIVYDEANRRSNFIDFGLMEDMKRTKQLCNNNQYGYANFHWSYPFESNLLNKAQYTEFAKSSLVDRQRFVRDLMKAFRDPKNKRGSWIRLFFQEAGIIDHSLQKNFFQWYYDFILNKLSTLSYNDFIDIYLNKMDVHGLGLSMMYVLNRTHQFMQPIFYDKLIHLLFCMVYPDPTVRCSIDQSIREYDRIMIITGLAKKHKIPGLYQNSPKPQAKAIEKIEKNIETGENIEKIWTSVSTKNSSKMSIDEKVASVLVELDPVPSRLKKSSTSFSDMHISTPSTENSGPMDISDISEKSNKNSGPMDVVKSSQTMTKPKTHKAQQNRKKRILNTRKMCSRGMKLNPITNRCQKENKPWSV